jgi:hypothetical protein
VYQEAAFAAVLAAPHVQGPPTAAHTLNHTCQTDSQICMDKSDKPGQICPDRSPRWKQEALSGGTQGYRSAAMQVVAQDHQCKPARLTLKAFRPKAQQLQPQKPQAYLQ